ncbi:MerR family transcriptional regulator [Methylobacterium gnaphalii]|uniref:MerR family transcriptional regulator n=1 Tax=Methylobacterium gnaphalii TaxID=1010610 RepID=A0A512JG07_9HYPH|nr:helix-turn-helix domain-containing protein [Methylobacterium gnaphalii]GEP08868.1 MerR family transcriptional regulator [Methylobacterium gnaphalii]GJD70351.1 HTH-type transcriptional regulator ZntR [Methylobacterium gnaphalii]GLS47633.1 MerR family transcriptional regulator [Methylobacterium gnaphalii]
MDLSIGDLSRSTGVLATTIRYYETADLMPPPPRTEGGRRRYGQADVERLAFIRHARELGFEVDAIRELLALAAEPERSCAEVDVIARHHLAEVERRIERLTALRGELSRMIGACGHGRVGECRVIEVLSDHGRCEDEGHRIERGRRAAKRGA